MTPGSRLLLVDYSNLFYRGSNAHADLSWKGKYTGGIYGFVNGLAHLVRQTQATRVVVCIDMKPYARTLDYPQYKHNRTLNDDEERLAALSQNREVVDTFLELIRCPKIGAQGFEADDVMAVLAKRHEYDHAEVILASNDNDLYQLLGQTNLSVYRGGKLGYYDSRKFFYDNPTLTDCQQWSEVVALAGGHNATPGIKGVGVKTAIKIVTDPAARQKHEEVLKDFMEIIEELEEYLKQLRAEAKGVEERIAELRKEG